MSLRLNLGSGQRPFAKPWINIDCQAKWNPDVLTDIRSMPCFDDNSAELIILWHVIEHMGLGEADPILSESYRILQTGGRLIVATPDLKALAEAWLRGDIDDYIYTVNLMGAYMGDESDRHKWNWSTEGLLGYLRKVAPWLAIIPFKGPGPRGTDISVDWWMAAWECAK